MHKKLVNTLLISIVLITLSTNFSVSPKGFEGFTYGSNLLFQGEPTFRLNITPPNVLTVAQGSMGVFTVTVIPFYGFREPVHLEASGLPSGTTWSFSVNDEAPMFTSKLAINVEDNVPVGTYEFKIEASGGGKKDVRKVYLTVLPFLPGSITPITTPTSPSVTPDFTLHVYPLSKAVYQGEKASFDVYMTPKGGFSGEVSLSVSGLPADATASFHRISSRKSKMEITAGQTTGTFKLRVKGQSNGVIRYVYISLEIKEKPVETPTITATTPQPKPPMPFNFSLYISPKQALLKPGETTAFTIVATHLSGEPRELSFEVTGLPPDFTYSFSPEKITPTGTVTLTVTAGSTTGSFALNVKAMGGGVIKTVWALIKVSGETKRKCVIATATYGSELSEEVQFLRSFRDNYVMSSYAGKNFMEAFNSFYYSFSPYIAEAIERNMFLKQIARACIYPLILTLKVTSSLSGLFVHMNGEVATLALGVSASVLLGIIYLTPPETLILLVLKKKKSVKRKHVKTLVLIVSLAFVGLIAGISVKSQLTVKIFSSLLVLTLIFVPASLVSLEITELILKGEGKSELERPNFSFK